MKNILEDLISANRTQRHDFMNNLQVIWGFIKINKSEKAIEYIQQIVDHLRSLRIINKVEQTELESTLLAKIIEIGINPNFSFSVSEHWKVNDEQILKVCELIDKIWLVIKKDLLHEKIKINLALEESKITIKANTIDEERVLDWNSVVDYSSVCGFECLVNQNDIIINL